MQNQDNLILIADECNSCGIDQEGFELVCAYHEDLFSCEDTLAITYEPIMANA